MNNSTERRTRRRKKEKKDFPVDTKVPKERETTTTRKKADFTDMSSGIIDIDDTPDVATWNKKIQIKDDTAAITVNRLHHAEEIEPPPTTIGVGLRGKKGSKKDLVIDPANKKEVAEAIKSGSILTDEAADLS
jgi:hypothetical protein